MLLEGDGKDVGVPAAQRDRQRQAALGRDDGRRLVREKIRDGVAAGSHIRDGDRPADAPRVGFRRGIRDDRDDTFILIAEGEGAQRR